MIGVGCDIVSVERIEKCYLRFGVKFAHRILSMDEWQTCKGRSNPIPYIAKRFAAKEAIVKAIGTGFQFGIRFQDITIKSDMKGAPVVLLSGKIQDFVKTLGVKKVLVSLSDEKKYAIAYAHLV
jgi:holo-[acyl-carrier protein] synthase